MFRNATKEDLPAILDLYEDAKKFMAACGNGQQWGDSYPREDILTEDIENRQLYVCEDNNKIRGVFAFIIGEDETYKKIENGAWLFDTPYGTIHRIASDRSQKGFFEEAVSYCEAMIPHIRIDTHEKNHIMRHLLEKNSFSQCGIIYVEDGTPRIAFEKINKN